MKTTFWNLLDTYKIAIPIIQRDYAQGRTDKNTTRIRQEILAKLKRALNENQPLDFDFVYGNSTSGVLYPLDGQQRLTTLFLMHWYFAAKASHSMCNKQSIEVKDKLSRFTYQTRVSSVRFCNYLVGFTPINDNIISETIVDQPWFAASWKNDPTIVAMLCMLDNIQQVFDCNHLAYFNKLTQSEIVHFRFLDMDEFNLSDELYIKMNARGKPLTEFENFKARFENYLQDYPQNTQTAISYKKRFIDNTDLKWTDIFWKEMASKMDIGFMRYIDFIAEIGFYLHQAQGLKIDDNDNEFKFQVFKNQDILDLLFNSLDSWSSKENIATYFQSYFCSYAYQSGKVKLYEENVNLFERCIKGISFFAKEKLMLYAVVLQLIAGKEQRRELRLIRNLLVNSPNEIRSDNMHAILVCIRDIMDGKTDYEILKTAFNGLQVEDEKVKSNFVLAYPALEDELYHFEDHHILMGRMAAFDLQPDTLEAYRKQFSVLFAKNVDKNSISRAILCFGDYSQEISSNRWRFANSSDTWHTIFTSKDVSKIKSTLSPLLNQMCQGRQIDQIITDKIAERTLSGNKLDWHYYFIKYPKMNDGSRGANYVWNKEFDICMLETTRLSGYWRDPYLWTLYCQLCEAEKAQVKDYWNIGWTKKPLNVSGIKISMCEGGWRVVLGQTDCSATESKYISLCSKYNIVDGILTVADTTDRISVGTELIRDIIL